MAPRRDDQLSADTKTAHFRPRPAQPSPATRTLIVIVKLLQRGFMSRNKGKGLARPLCPPASPAQPSPGILRCPMSVVIFCSQLAGLCSGCSGAHWPAGASSGYTDDWAAAACAWMLLTLILLLIIILYTSVTNSAISRDSFH